jgi:hypothetical protein
MLALKRMRKANIDVYLTVIVRDKNGKVVYRRRYKSRSFVEGFLNALYSNFINSVNGGSFTHFNSPNMVVGSGRTPPSISDSGLTSQIGIGTGAGQLQYGSDSLNAPIIDLNNNRASFTWSKTFGNGSGGNVTVSEVGAYVNLSPLLGGSTSTYFILHDLLPSPITLSPSQVLTVVYTIIVST